MNSPYKTSQRNRERGNGVIEFALVLPIMVALFLGTLAFGYGYYLYAELEAAVRSGARYASITTYDASNIVTYQTAVQKMVVFGDPGGTAQPVVPGLQTSNVSVVVGVSNSGAPTSVTVSISGYKLPGMFFYGGTMINKPNLQIPFLGDYVPL